jgi:hypothetical protein
MYTKQSFLSCFSTTTGGPPQRRSNYAPGDKSIRPEVFDRGFNALEFDQAPRRLPIVIDLEKAFDINAYRYYKRQAVVRRLTAGGGVFCVYVCVL